MQWENKLLDDKFDWNYSGKPEEFYKTCLFYQW